jgi:hypothetical protein
MFPLYSYYGLRRPMAARMVFPQLASVEVRATWRDKLCGNYVRAEDKVEDVLRQKVDDELQKKNLPPTRFFDHIYLQLQYAPQIIYHHPFHPHQMLPGAEVDPLLGQVGVNFVMHDDEHRGFEVSFVVQGSFNYSFFDPNRNNPNETEAGRDAWQGQYQLQAAYAFPNLLGVDGLTLTILAQASRSVTYQYDPTQQKNVTTRASTLAGGFQISKSLGKDSPFSAGGQVTVGGGTGQTLDVTGQVFFQWQYDFLPPKPKPDPNPKPNPKPEKKCRENW